jgi:hypothetical protein
VSDQVVDVLLEIAVLEIAVPEIVARHVGRHRNDDRPTPPHCTGYHLDA